MKNKNGFTLIELLIVVLIIAILAAIAVPNFLEFQTRAKISRAVSDMRSLGIALEAYYVDNESYPRDHDDNPLAETGCLDRFNFSCSVGLYYVTTPISYMSTVPFDPFNRFDALSARYQSTNYVLSSGGDNQVVSNVPNCDCYFMNSIGADGLDNTGNQDQFPWGGSADYVFFYDPTNGTTSAGDIYRFGGNYRQGNYVIGDVANGGSTISWETWGNFGPIIPGS